MEKKLIIEEIKKQEKIKKGSRCECFGFENCHGIEHGNIFISELSMEMHLKCPIHGPTRMIHEMVTKTWKMLDSILESSKKTINLAFESILIKISRIENPIARAIALCQFIAQVAKTLPPTEETKGVFKIKL